ncbi:MAG: S8 family serine peptidase [Phycisphaerales bacterium]|nr:S8 family serine peptidase [Phycisphaerales bacterium]
MMRSFVTSLGSVVGLFILALAPAPHAAAQNADPPVVGRAIVRVPDAPGGVHDIDAFIAEFAQGEGIVMTIGDSMLRPAETPPFYAYLLEYPARNQVEVQLALDPENQPSSEYELSGAIVWGEALYAGEASEGKSGSAWVASLDPAHFTNQYPIDLLGLDAAHDRSTGLGVVVAIIDSGIDIAHPALAGRIAPGGLNLIDGTPNVADVGDGVDTDGDLLVDEMVGHGTFVAGLVSLTAPDAKLLPVKVLNGDGTGDGWIVAKGMMYAIDRGVEVINLSLGSTYDSAAIEDAIDIAMQHGIVVVSAGGNQNEGEGDFEEFPASKSDGMGVAATDANDIKATFSNYNDKFSLSAPGDSVPQAGDPDGWNPTKSIYSTLPGGGYGIWEGTSFSTAFVSGAAALIRAQHPEWSASLTTALNVQGYLEGTAVDIYPQNPQYADDESLGVGRLNAAAATMISPPAPALGDLNRDGSVNADDLAVMLAAWGLTHSSADLDGDGIVGPADLAILLAQWS